MYKQFSLTLVVNHACNLRCRYCYTGEKFNRAMPEETGTSAIDRALASLSGFGQLELGFFGGEPLLEAARIGRWIRFARQRQYTQPFSLRIGLTTNGTVTTDEAWRLMTSPDTELRVSCDGPEEVHDRHRRDVRGHGSFGAVMKTLRSLQEAGKDFGVVSVVRPDTVEFLPQVLEFFYKARLTRIDLTLDLWAQWTTPAMDLLEDATARAARFWRDHLPDLSINWFDEKLARSTAVPMTDTTARCGFGCGEVAVAPSGHFYPCERLVGDDQSFNPSRLSADTFRAHSFLPAASGRSTTSRFSGQRDCTACESCGIRDLCGTTCRCSNLIRTGNTAKPDGLLCRWEKACFRGAALAFDNERTQMKYEQERNQ